MKLKIHMFRIGVVVLLLLTAACSPENDSNDNEANNDENSQESEDDIAPAFADIEDATDVIQDSVSLDDFEAETIPSNTDASYEMDVQMDEEGTFELDTHVTIENQSDDTWDHLVFYVIPNAFTEENKPEDIEGASEVDMEEVEVNDANVPYSLEDDTLAIELENPLESGESTETDISYTFTVPEGGFRFSNIKDDYFLGQFHPMLATYEDGWNKEDYNPTGESYHTDFSDFSVTYDVPEDYTVFSSADNEDTDAEETGELEMENIKEFFMAVMKTDDLEVHEEEYDGTEVRVIMGEDMKGSKYYVDTAVGSLQFFDENIGEYPHEQLDVIVTDDEEGGMEYPGIVTVMENMQAMEEIVSHEIGHQWFYGMVTNDAFHDPLVDEGMTQFATYLYIIDSNDAIDYDEMVENLEELFDGMIDSDDVLPANLALDGYEDNQEIYSYSVYTQTAYQLLKLFQDHGEMEGALDFLHDYFETYQYEQIDTEELVNYLNSYLDLEMDDAFEEWLDVRFEEED